MKRNYHLGALCALILICSVVGSLSASAGYEEQTLEEETEDLSLIGVYTAYKGAIQAKKVEAKAAFDQLLKEQPLSKSSLSQPEAHQLLNFAVIYNDHALINDLSKIFKLNNNKLASLINNLCKNPHGPAADVRATFQALLDALDPKPTHEGLHELFLECVKEGSSVLYELFIKTYKIDLDSLIEGEIPLLVAAEACAQAETTRDMFKHGRSVAALIDAGAAVDIFDQEAYSVMQEGDIQLPTSALAHILTIKTTEKAEQEIPERVAFKQMMITTLVNHGARLSQLDEQYIASVYPKSWEEIIRTIPEYPENTPVKLPTIISRSSGYGNVKLRSPSRHISPTKLRPVSETWRPKSTQPMLPAVEKEIKEIKTLAQPRRKKSIIKPLMLLSLTTAGIVSFYLWAKKRWGSREDEALHDIDEEDDISSTTTQHPPSYATPMVNDSSFSSTIHKETL